MQSVLHHISTTRSQGKLLEEPIFIGTLNNDEHSSSNISSYDAIVSVIMLLKSYLVLRLFGQYSEWTSVKAIRAW